MAFSSSSILFQFLPSDSAFCVQFNSSFNFFSQSFSIRTKMLTCIARPKKPGNDSPSKPDDSDPNNAAKNQAVKSLTTQVSVEQMNSIL